VATTFLAFLPSVAAPFLFDDYTHLAMAGGETLPALLHRVLVDHPSGGDLFFRPLGELYYWLLWRLDGVNPVPWHLAGITLHCANTLLVYGLARRLDIPGIAAFFGAAFFAWTGVHVEDVCWLAASFDLLATFFSLLALLQCLHRGRAAVAGTAICCVLACLSKESAYCLPLLILSLAFFRGGTDRNRIFRSALAVGLWCGLVFLYRLWYLHGVGGYHNAAGQSQAFSLHFLSTVQALLLRIWGVFFLPVNWSVSAELWLKVAAAVMLAGAGSMSFLVGKCRLGPAILFVLCAALPVVPLLLIGPDLSGARVLYLPSVGVSLLWMQMWSRCNSRAATLIALPVVLFQLAGLWHNQRIWVQVAERAHDACVDTADMLRENPGTTVVARDLPKTLNGVFFLANGFAQCVALNGGVEATRVRDSSVAGSDAREIHWNAQTGRMQW
jgi:hypothetical protein